MKEEILRLRAENKTYAEIERVTGAAMSTIRYHCDPHYKDCARKRRSRNKKKTLTEFKIKFGGTCKICGYDKCLDALDFHHLEPDKKDDSVMTILARNGVVAAMEEAQKCVLICCRCHREVHAGITKIEGAC